MEGPETSGTRRPRSFVVLTGSIGGGHDSTASAVAAALSAKGAETRIVTLMDRGPAKILPHLYTFMTKKSPQIYGIYIRLRRTPGFSHANSLSARIALSSHMSDLPTNCDCLIITQGVYCNEMRSLTRAFPHVSVMPSDLFGGVPEWFTKGASSYIVPSRQMQSLALHAGVPADKILVRRLPSLVPPSAQRARYSTAPIKKILLVGGTVGVGPIGSILRGLVDSGQTLDIHVICGYNAKLLQRLSKTFGNTITLHGFVPELHSLFLQFDLVITKPGSATLMELLELRIPFLVMPGVAEVETPNMITVTEKTNIQPLMTSVDARRAMSELCDKDGILKPAGREWLESHEVLRSELPVQSVSIEDFLSELTV